MYAQVFKMVSLYKYCFNSCLYWNYDFGNSLMTTDLRIDGDVICYMAGHAADSRGGGLSHSLYNTKLIMMSIIDKFSPCNVNTYLTSRNPKDNFRTEIYPAYKQNRTQCPKCKCPVGRSPVRIRFFSVMIESLLRLKSRFYWQFLSR